MHSAIAQDPVNPDRVYVLFGGGGLWTTGNFFASAPQWTPRTDHLGVISWGAMALGSTPGTVYISSGDPFIPLGQQVVVFKSTGACVE